MQSLGYGLNDRHQTSVLILIDNSIFYWRSKEYRNVTWNAVFVISHCLHLLNVLRNTISCKRICNYVSAGLELFSHLSIYIFLQELGRGIADFHERNRLHDPAYSELKTNNHLYTFGILCLYIYHDLVTLAKSYVDVSSINVSSNRSQIMINI